MIDISNYEVVGWEHAIRGMRNPMNSWEKSDSTICYHADGCEKTRTCDSCPGCYDIGSNDHNLMMKLRNAGSDHRKFMRMITVYVDILAPLYWWKEFDTYKVGTVANSCSTMHKIHAKELTVDDFSCERLSSIDIGQGVGAPYQMLKNVINMLNACRELYLQTKDKYYWNQMIQLLPSSYNQKRTVMLNYEVLANIYRARRSHKLDEWHDFCDWIESLPYSELIIGEVAEKETSFQEDLYFFVNDCTKAQLRVLYERVGEKLKEVNDDKS